MDAAGSDTDLFWHGGKCNNRNCKKGLIPVLIRTGVFTEQELKTLTSHGNWRIEHSLTHILPWWNREHHHFLNAKQSSNYRYNYKQ
jgi:hypothetical protein